MTQAQIEAMGLKISSLERQVIYAPTDNERKAAGNQVTALWWVANLLGVSEKVSEIRLRETAMDNKVFEAGRKGAEEAKQ